MIRDLMPPRVSLQSLEESHQTFESAPPTAPFEEAYAAVDADHQVYKPRIKQQATLHSRYPRLRHKRDASITESREDEAHIHDKSFEGLSGYVLL